MTRQSPPPSYWSQPPRGNARAAMSGPKLLAIFGGVLALIVIVAMVLVSAVAPTPPPPSCLPGEVCGGPPATPPPISGDRTPDPATSATPTTPARTAEPADPASPAPSPVPTPAPTTAPTPPPTTADPPAPIVVDPAVPALRVWPVHAGPNGSYQLFYPPFLSPDVRADGSVIFGAAIPAQDVEVHIRVNAAPASTSPNDLLEQMVEAARGRISSMVVDDGPDSRIHRPSIGHLPAIVRTYRGDLGSAGSVRPVALVVMTATDGRTTVAINVLVVDPDAVLPGAEKRWFRLAGSVVDPILKRFEWGSGT